METTDPAPRGFARVLTESRGFRRRAEAEAKEPGRVRRLARRASDKFARHRDQLGALRDDLPVLLRLARAWARGEYRAVPWRSLVLLVGALLYFVAPVDAIPDVIPLVGYLDDAAVIAYVLRAIGKDVDAFAAWEASAESPGALPERA